MTVPGCKGEEMKQTMLTEWNQVPIIIDLPFASRLLGVTVECLKKRAQRGTLPGAFRCGGVWRVDKNRLKKSIEGN